MSLHTGVWFPTIRTGTGVDSFTRNLVRGLNQRGVRAEISWLPPRAEYLPWSVAAPQLPSWAGVVHINSWLPLRFVPARLPSVVTLHSCVHDPVLRPYKSFAQDLYHRRWVYFQERRTIAAAASVTAVSHYTRRKAMETFGIEKVETVFNWVDSNHFVPLSKERRSRPFRLLFVGKPSKRKGVDLLLLLMRQLGPDYELHCTARAEELSSYGKVPSNVFAQGRLTDPDSLVQLYQSSDLLILPSRLEGLPLAVLEAAACGVPTVGPASSSFPEVVEQNVTGILCPPEDLDAYEAAVRMLRDDPERLLALSRNARERAVRHYSEESALAKYMQIYRELTSQKGGWREGRVQN